MTAAAQQKSAQAEEMRNHLRGLLETAQMSRKAAAALAGVTVRDMHSLLDPKSPPRVELAKRVILVVENYIERNSTNHIPGTLAVPHLPSDLETFGSMSGYLDYLLSQTNTPQAT